MSKDIIDDDFDFSTMSKEDLTIALIGATNVAMRMLAEGYEEDIKFALMMFNRINNAAKAAGISVTTSKPVVLQGTLPQLVPRHRYRIESITR